MQGLRKWYRAEAALLLVALVGCGGSGGTPDGRVVDIDAAAACGMPGSVRPGWPCQCAADCSNSNTCMLEAELGIPGGICIRVCESDADCGADGLCISDPAVSTPTVPGVCSPSCSDNADCPPARSCTELDGDRWCFPICQADSECDSGNCDVHTGKCTDGTPSMGLGVLRLCARDSECRSGRCSPAGDCFLQCSVARAACPDGMLCSAPAGDDLGLCQPVCTANAECSSHPQSICAEAFVPSDVGICWHTEEDVSDPCTTGGFNIAETAGCNGEPLGPGVPDNEFGGRCISEPDSCVPPTFCLDGTCIQQCPPAAGFIGSSTCPSGSRCWSADGFGACFPDCRVDEDCPYGFCNDFGSCA